MQIWWTTWSAPRSSHMKIRLVRLRCFLLTMLPQKSLVASLIWSILFHSLHVFVFLNASRSEWNLPQQRKCFFFGSSVRLWGETKQIWQTTWSAARLCRMKTRLVRLKCFLLTMLPQRSLASSSIWSILFRPPCMFLCSWMPQEESEIFHSRKCFFFSFSVRLWGRGKPNRWMLSLVSTTGQFIRLVINYTVVYLFCVILCKWTQM